MALNVWGTMRISEGLIAEESSGDSVDSAYAKQPKSANRSIVVAGLGCVLRPIETAGGELANTFKSINITRSNSVLLAAN